MRRIIMIAPEPNPTTCPYRALPYVKAACRQCSHIVGCHYS